MHVCLVEDELLLSNSIQKFCELKQYKVTSFHDGEDAYNDITVNSNYTLYIIDINLPNISGLDILKKVKTLQTDIPVIIITASLEIEPLEEAFLLGCNEYIKKPFNLKELDLRIQKVLEKKLTIYQITSELIFDFESKSLIYKNEDIELRLKERRFLEILIKNFNFIVPTTTIEEYVWEGEIKETYPLRQLVNTLREKLPLNFIKTEIGMGYKATNDV